MGTLILAIALLAIFAFAVEHSNTTAILAIACETMLLLNVSAALFDGVPAFLISLISATVLVLIADHLSD